MTLTLKEARWRRDTAHAAGEHDKAMAYHRVASALLEVERHEKPLRDARAKLAGAIAEISTTTHASE